MNSYRRGLRDGVLVNPKLFVLEKVNLAPPTIGWSTWSNLVKLVLFGAGHYRATGGETKNERRNGGGEGENAEGYKLLNGHRCERRPSGYFNSRRSERWSLKNF